MAVCVCAWQSFFIFFMRQSRVIYYSLKIIGGEFSRKWDAQRGKVMEKGIKRASWGMRREIFIFFWGLNLLGTPWDQVIGRNFELFFIFLELF